VAQGGRGRGRRAGAVLACIFAFAVPGSTVLAAAPAAPASSTPAAAKVPATAAPANAPAATVAPATPAALRGLAGVPDSALAIEIARDGLEGVAVARHGTTASVAYENRRYRKPAVALGHIALQGRASDDPPRDFLTIERRLGLPVAAMPFRAGEAPDRVLYPGDPAFPESPGGRRWGASERSVDLFLRPLVSYELGRIYDPVLLRFELAPEVRYNPWPGARAVASVVIPVRNDFAVDQTHPDVNNIRPGVSTVEQYLWLRWSLLASGCAGIFDGNRYGASAGLARPIAGGLVLLDAQADITGYLAFPDSGVSYSSPEHWTGFAGFSIRPFNIPASLRVRAQRFLYGDHGLEMQVERSLGDVDLALFAQRIEGDNLGGIRLSLPLPPFDRGVGAPVRVGLTENFNINYRDEVSNLGIPISGVASREDLLRNLDTSTLRASRYRHMQAAGTPMEKPSHRVEPVSLTGMTGMINTPWCGVMPDGDIELGYNVIPKEAAYDNRNLHRNDVYYAAIGFLPHIEVGLRWTVIPGLKSFQDIAPDSKLTDSDRMVSGRIEVLEPRPGRPGLALGIEDATGTRRFHSEYAVTGIESPTWPLQARLSVGYAFTALTATRYTLEGAFGAVAVRPWRASEVALEHDSEKVNALLGFGVGLGFQARFALLDLRHPAAGIGWSHAL
jgi:exopolysaccharide biosynthesis protein YbjH